MSWISWFTLALVVFVVSIPMILLVCSGFNWNDDERQAEAEGLGYVGGQGHEHNGTARPWLDDPVSAQDDDRHRTSLGTDGGDPR